MSQIDPTIASSLGFGVTNGSDDDHVPLMLSGLLTLLVIAVVGVSLWMIDSFFRWHLR